MNSVVLHGRLTRDPQIKNLPGDKKVCEFGIARNEKYGSKESTIFVDCSAWGKTGEIISQHLKKGDPIIVAGSLRFDQWDAPDGGKRSKLSVNVDRFDFVGGRKERDDDNPF